MENQTPIFRVQGECSLIKLYPHGGSTESWTPIYGVTSRYNIPLYYRTIGSRNEIWTRVARLKVSYLHQLDDATRPTGLNPDQLGYYA